MSTSTLYNFIFRKNYQGTTVVINKDITVTITCHSLSEAKRILIQKGFHLNEFTYIYKTCNN